MTATTGNFPEVQRLQNEYAEIHRRALRSECRPGDPETEIMIAREMEIRDRLTALGAPMFGKGE